MSPRPANSSRGLEVEIVDEASRPLPHNGESTGEILIRGPWVCSEYYRDPQPERFREGWLITGDVGKIDDEEYLIISDRSKDLVKSGGEWISSVDLENHLVALHGVAQACVVAQPHPKWDERPVALIVRAGDTEIDTEDIVAHCATRFARWQLPDDVLFVDSIPLTSTGKNGQEGRPRASRGGRLQVAGASGVAFATDQTPAPSRETYPVTRHLRTPGGR